MLMHINGDTAGMRISTITQVARRRTGIKTMRQFRQRIITFSITCSALAAAMFASPAAGLAGPAPQAAHEALTPRIAPYEITYRISLKEAQERAGIVLADGSLFSRLEGGACAGWSTTSGMKVRFVFRREGVRETESRVISWESDDGNQFISRIERLLNGAPVERIRARAERAAPGLPFRLSLKLPEKRSALLPPDTLFPTAALKKLLRAAASGKRTLSMLLYEGDEELSPQHVVAIIGKKRAPLTSARDTGAAAAAVPEALRGLAYWPVSLAYYGPIRRADGSKPDEKEQEAARFGLPEYEVHFRLYENGITGEATLVYPDYTLKAAVEKVRLLPEEKCR